MSSELKRKLTAIMFTDMVGFTAMMQNDEQETQKLVEMQRELMKPIVSKYSGEIVSYIGDAILCTFDSGIAAVDCAIELQRALKVQEKIILRIGIHVGDIVFKDDDIYGDGVNVASRIEPSAEPGGICISETVYENVKNHSGVECVFIGQKKLKNVKRPMEVYALVGEGLATPQIKRKYLPKSVTKKLLWASLSLLVLIVAYMIIPKQNDVPSVGILYIENLGDERDEYWARGITEDIIIEVASAGMIRVPPLREIIDMKKSDLSLKSIAEKLRVNHILTSSLRKSEGTLDLRVQLIEAKSGNSLYAEKLFEPIETASSITGTIAKNILEKLGVVSESKITQSYTSDPVAYDFYLKGKYRYDKKESQVDTEIAQGLFKKAIDLDPEFFEARIELATIYIDLSAYEKALPILNETLNLVALEDYKSGEAKVLAGIGRIYSEKGEYDSAISYLDRSLKISNEIEDKSSESVILQELGEVYFLRNDYHKALEYYTISLEIREELGDIKEVAKGLLMMGDIQYRQGQYTEANRFYSRSLNLSQEISNRGSEAEALGSISNVYAVQGEYDPALDFGIRSLEIFKELGIRRFESVMLSNVGRIFDEEGEYDKAIQYYTNALKIFRETGLEVYGARTLGVIGDAYRSKGEYRVAVDTLRQSIKILKSKGIKESYSVFLSSLLLAESNLGNKNAATAILEELEPQLESIPDNTNYAYLMLNVSKSLTILERHEEARSYLDIAYNIVIRLADEIENEESRNTFLTRVRTNREIIKAWEDLPNL